MTENPLVKCEECVYAEFYGDDTKPAWLCHRSSPKRKVNDELPLWPLLEDWDGPFCGEGRRKRPKNAVEAHNEAVETAQAVAEAFPPVYDGDPDWLPRSGIQVKPFPGGISDEISPGVTEGREKEHE